ncbi:MAG: class I adenylate-forming enzyme family protein [Parvularculaceae bacterium]
MAEVAPMDPAKAAAAAYKLLVENPLFKVGEAEIRGNIYRVFENAPPHLPALFAYGAATHGDKEFLAFEGERISFAELWARSCRFARALEKDLGVKRGDKVALAMRNFPEWCVAYIAVISLGAVVVPLNAWWKADELKYGLKDCGAKIAIVDGKRLEYMAPFKDELGVTFILARDAGAGADHRYEDLIAAHNDASPLSVDIHPDDDYCIVYTSGSTGNPKGVVLTHRGAISTLFSWTFVAAIIKELRDGVSPFGDNPGVLLGIPLFHVTGSHSIFMLSIWSGGASS